MNALFFWMIMAQLNPPGMAKPELDLPPISIEDAHLFDQYQMVREENWKQANAYEEWLWSQKWAFVVNTDYEVHKKRASYLCKCWYWLNEANTAVFYSTFECGGEWKVLDNEPDYQRRVEALMNLRSLLGPENFYAGYMPVPLIAPY